MKKAKSIIGVLLSCYLLMGSTMLPLGDFSLIADLPGMYNSYCVIKSGEPDIIDFLGDYVLGGKYLFGNNKEDAPPRSDGSLQFQHQPNANLFFVVHGCKLPAQPAIDQRMPLAAEIFYNVSDFYGEILRPPIS